MKTIILWTLFSVGPNPYIVARDLTNQQCQQMKNDMATPVGLAPYKVRQRQQRKLVCKAQT